MKILALEKELNIIDWTSQNELLKEESRIVYNFYQEGTIREIYFNESKNAIMILECESISKAEEFLLSLPLVKEGLITFTLMELNPYTGFDRIINNE
jgi:hypothetical protein